MKRTLLACALALATLPALAQKPLHTFTTEGDHFTLDGKPFKILSGELHYARIPREYWHARLKMAKAMGLNTIATYVFWNVHEPSPGVYDFSGNNDLAAFLKAAQEEGLYVILRSGPYACAEWDLGGLPAWLLADPKSAAVLRSNDPLFMVPAERWITRLSQEVLPLQIGRGGPILMTQIENEYGQFGPSPPEQSNSYIQHLHDIYVKLGFKESFLYTADNWRHIPEGSIPGLFASVNFGIKNHKGGMDALAKARPGQALFVSEYWPGWFDHWGHPHETRPIPPQLEDIDYILTRGAGINIYMFHGGTSFGFYAGSSYIKDKFLPDVTSYDYDAPLDESGRPTPKYFAYRKELAKFSPCGNESCLPPVPTVAAPITIPTIALKESTSLFNNLPKPTVTALPAPMETFGQNFGYILYRTHIPATQGGQLAIGGLHDYAEVFVNGYHSGTLDRRYADPQGKLPVLTINTGAAPAQLDILVANDGRVNVDLTMRTESKGIVGPVALDGRPLSDWQVYSLPMTSLPAGAYHLSPVLVPRKPPSQSFIDHPPFPPCGPASGHDCPTPAQVAASATDPPYLELLTGRLPPSFFHATFQLSSVGDTFLDVRNLGKGAVWINGHALGRFWTAGPQQTLYVPGPWLKTGSNEIVVFDMMPNPKPSVAGLDHPILDAPVANTTRSQQE